MDKNTILAIVLSALVMIGWLYFYAPEPMNVTTQEQQTESVVKDEPGSEQPEKSETVVDVDTSSIDESSLSEETHTISTDIYTAVLTNRGAKIVSLLYGDREIELVAPNEYSEGYIDCSFYLSDKEFLQGSDLENQLWYVSEKENSRIVYSRKIKINGKPVVVNKIFSFKSGEYYFDLTYQFKNETDSAVAIPNGKIIFSANDFIGPRMNNYKNRYNITKQLYYTDGKKKFSKGGGFFKDAKDIEIINKKGEWTGIISRYFASVLVADGERSDGIISDAAKNTSSRTGLFYSLPVLAENQTKPYKFKVAIAEKKKNILSTVQPNLEAASDTNKFIDPIRVAVLWSLKKLNVFIPNYGWCIIIFSILTKLLFLPLTQKSTESMKKMSKLQPEIQKIKDKYKDDQQKVQEETMKLYKERGVNPMGGCLPLIVQMPFFIALYSALINSVELWNTPFIFWINDLSLPDTAFAVAGFDIHILPLIMTVTSFFQQKVSTVDTGAASQQQMMLKIMPVILLFIFWSMPSGLIMYWTIQNILQVGHQLFVNRKKG